MAGDPATPPKGIPADALDRLYHGPLDEFTQARNELAKRLNAEGDKGTAEWVKGLRKPTRAAWIANQLAVRRRRDVGKLLEAGEKLRALQEALLGGGADRDELRVAARAERDAIERLLRSAREIAAEHEAGPAAVDRVGETLQAAAVDEELAERLRLGRLTREQRASSLGLAGGGASAAPATRKAPGRRGKGRNRDADTDAGAAEVRARRELARRRAAAERKLATAERRLERERAAAKRARGALVERERKVAEAERSLAAARQELKDAGRERP